MTTGQNGNGFSLTAALSQGIILTRTFPNVPKKRFHFRFRLYLSEEFANRREAAIGATPEERAALMRGFKTQIIADALADVPEVEEDTAIVGEVNRYDLPDFPTEGTLRERATQYFGQKDAEGNQILWFLVESLFQDYWDKALPSNFPPSPSDSRAPLDLSSKAP